MWHLLSYELNTSPSCLPEYKIIRERPCQRSHSWKVFPPKGSAMWHSAPLKTWARGLLAGSLPGIRGLMMVFAVVMDCCHLRLCIIYLSHTYVLIHPICKHRTDVTLSNIQVCHPCTNLRSRDIPGDLAWEEFPSSSDGASPQHRDTGTSPHAFCASVFQPVIGGELLPLSRGN